MPTIMTVTLGAVLNWNTEAAAVNPDVWYRFDESSGNVLNYGSLGSGADLAQASAGGSFNGTYLANGPRGNASAIDFGGVGKLNTPTDWGTSSTGTFFMVINYNGTTSGGTWIASSSTGFDDDGIFFRSSGNSMALHWQNTSVNGSTYTGSVNINDGQWHTVALVERGDTVNGPDFYFDGVLDTSAVLNAVDPIPGYWYDNFNPNENQIGSRGGVGSGTPRFSGLMDEFLYVDGVQLSQSEISDLHTAAIFGS